MEDIYINASLLPGNTTNQTNQTFIFLCDHSTTTKSLKISAFLVLLFFSLVGNSVIVAVFFRNRELRAPINYFILNMTLSDLLIPLVVIPQRISQIQHNGEWYFEGTIGVFLCKVLSLPLSVSTAVSALTMVVIAGERFHSILFAMRRPLIPNETCPFIIVATWIIAVAFRGHYLYAYTVVHVPGSGNFCIFVWDVATREALKINWIIFFVCLTAVPLVLLTVLYSSIIIYLNRQESRLLLASEILQHRAHENRRITCMLITIIIVFVLAWTPYHLDLVLYYTAPSVQPPCSFLFLATFLPNTYTVINPVLYCIFNEKYRKGSRKILGCIVPLRCFHVTVSPE